MGNIIGYYVLDVECSNREAHFIPRQYDWQTDEGYYDIPSFEAVELTRKECIKLVKKGGWYIDKEVIKLDKSTMI